MLDLEQEWSISFAGCGFMGIYYVGASSCVLQRFPRFFQEASSISGASAGALMAAVLSVGLPVEKCCSDLMFMATEARRHRLGPLHPAYDLLHIVKQSLLRSLPEDAHLRASGKLCVSLTRVSDRRNLLVSEFSSREELIEALLCSCFVPFYCGMIPPTYRGVHYVDGAVSDNLPRCHVKNTFTFSAYAGESDVCPRGSASGLHQVRFNNVSIQVNSENMFRVASTFFPPEPEVMAEICRNGYMDALRFLQDNNLISADGPMRSLEPEAAEPGCCESESREKDDHSWLNPRLIEELPINIRRVLCKACRESHSSGGLLAQVSDLLPRNMTSYLYIPRILPMGSASSLAQRLVDMIPEVPRDMSWLYEKVGDVYKQAWSSDEDDFSSETPLRRCTSLPSGLNLDSLPLTPEASPSSSLSFSWSPRPEVKHTPLSPPPTPTLSSSAGFDGAAAESPSSTGGGAGGVWGLGRAVGWIRNITSEQSSSCLQTDDSSSRVDQ